MRRATSARTAPDAVEPKPLTQIQLRGGVRELFEHASDMPVVLEGGTNTGKTHGACEYIHATASRYPGARILMLRRTRISLIDTVLVKPWESSVIANALRRKLVKVEGGSHRSAYQYRNGSVVIPGGLDHADKYMSGQYDLVAIFEATETKLEHFEKLSTRMSREDTGVPHSFIILDVNPGPKSHWINQEAEAGRILRLKSRHHHNPLLYDAVRKPEGGWRYVPTARGRKYMARLDKLRGVARRRYRDHEWVTAEGLVLAEYDPDLHLVDRWKTDQIPRKAWQFAWMSMDWGHAAPGCLQLWACSGDIAYRLWEVYWREKRLDWWAQRAVELAKWAQLNLGKAPETCETGHENTEGIATFNDFLAKSGSPTRARIANNARETGLDIVRYFLRPNESGARLYLVRDAQWKGRDPSLEEKLLPGGLEEELESYVWAETKDGRPIPETPDPGCQDHAIDSARYGLVWAHKRLGVGEIRPKVIEPAQGTYEWNQEQERRAVMGEKPLAPRAATWSGVHGIGQHHGR